MAEERTLTPHRDLAGSRRAGIGSTVSVVDRAGRITEYELVARPPAPRPRRVTVDSPEGASLVGARGGEFVQLRAGNGRRRRVRVLAVSR